MHLGVAQFGIYHCCEKIVFAKEFQSTSKKSVDVVLCQSLPPCDYSRIVQYTVSGIPTKGLTEIFPQDQWQIGHRHSLAQLQSNNRCVCIQYYYKPKSSSWQHILHVPNDFLRLLRHVTKVRLFANTIKSLQLAKEGTIGILEDRWSMIT